MFSFQRWKENMIFEVATKQAGTKICWMVYRDINHGDHHDQGFILINLFLYWSIFQIPIWTHKKSINVIYIQQAQVFDLETFVYSKDRCLLCSVNFFGYIYIYRSIKWSFVPGIIPRIMCLFKRKLSIITLKVSHWSRYAISDPLLELHKASGHLAGLKKVSKKKTFFLGLCPKHRTPPTHRACLGLH